MKTASRILGTAFFLEGFEVQDAPRYGAERRGAPIFAYVRADRTPIFERGVIQSPDLVLVADETIVPLAAAGVLAGLDADSLLVISGEARETAWRETLNLPGRVIVLPLPEGEDVTERRHVGVRLAAAAARLTGAVSLSAVEKAIARELEEFGPDTVAENQNHARAAWDLAAADEGVVHERAGPTASDYARPQWIDLDAEDAGHAAPIVHAGATSVEVRTGLWRVVRPVIDTTHCTKCRICVAACPDGAIGLGAEGWPDIDLDHCKGCMVCVAQCPTHTIAAVTETAAREAESRGEAVPLPAPAGTRKELRS